MHDKFDNRQHLDECVYFLFFFWLMVKDSQSAAETSFEVVQLYGQEAFMKISVVFEYSTYPQNHY